METKTIVAKARTNVEKLNVHRDSFDTYNDGILEIVNENSDLEDMIRKKQGEVVEMKLKCRKQMEELQAIKRN